MNIYIANAIALPLFFTWFIPNVIRDPKSGEYKGFRNSAVAVQFVFLLIIESYLLVGEQGMSLLTIFRIAFNIALAFSFALLFVKYTQKQLFGNEFKMEVKRRGQE